MKQDPAAQLTVIVPTYRRPRFLRRLLDYAETVRFPFKILVADSSDGDELRQNIARIAACSPHLHVEHLHFTCGLMEKLFCSVKGVTTPCCCLWADDDFQLPRGLISCLEYLEDHSDYVSCMGQFMAVRRNEDCTDILLETFPSRGESSTSERILRWSENFYSSFYAVYRTPVLMEMLRVGVVASCYERCRIIPEILMGQMALLLGRQRMIEGVSIVYQMHAGNDSRLTPCVKDHTAFPMDYTHYRSEMAALVSQSAGLSLSEADWLVDRSFRNVYRWTGGRWWIFKKIIENVRRPWRRLLLRLDAKRSAPRFTCISKQRLQVSDVRLESGDVAIALAAIARHPDGVSLSATCRQPDEGVTG